MDQKYYVYLLCCADHSFYCGYTVNLEKRVSTHNRGTGGKYTRGRRPVTLIYWEEFSEKSSALKREYAIKQLTRPQKQALISTKKDEKKLLKKF